MVGVDGSGAMGIAISQFIPSNPPLQVHCVLDVQLPELEAMQFAAHCTVWKEKYEIELELDDVIVYSVELETNVWGLLIPGYSSPAMGSGRFDSQTTRISV